MTDAYRDHSTPDPLVENFEPYISQALRELQELLQHLCHYGDALVVVTGKPGAGKTTFADYFIGEARADNKVISLSAQQTTTPSELLAHVALNFAIPRQSQLSELLALIHQQAANSIVVIDDADNLSDVCLQMLIELVSLQDGQCFCHLVLLGTDEVLTRLQGLARHKAEGFIHPLAIPQIQPSDAARYLNHVLLGDSESEADIFPPTWIERVLYQIDGDLGKLKQEGREFLADDTTSTPVKTKIGGALLRNHGLKIAGGAVVLTILAMMSVLVVSWRQMTATPAVDAQWLSLRKQLATVHTKNSALQARIAILEKSQEKAQAAIDELHNRLVMSHAKHHTQVKKLMIDPVKIDHHEAKKPSPKKITAKKPVIHKKRTHVKHHAQKTKPHASKLKTHHVKHQRVIIKPVKTTHKTKPHQKASKQIVKVFLPTESGHGSKQTVTIVRTHTQTIIDEPKKVTRHKKTTHKKVTQRAKANIKAKSEQSHYYTLQLVGARRKSSIELFMHQQHLEHKSRVTHRKLKGRDWYELEYGHFNTFSEAMNAITKLPKDLQKRQPWVKAHKG